MTTPVPLVTAGVVCTLLARELPAAGPQRDQLDALCVRASNLIRSRPDLAVDARIAAGSLSPGLVEGVAADMVIAALETIELGFRSTGEQYPELQTTNVAATARLVVELTDAQRAQLAPLGVPGAQGSGMYIVPLS
ncbi:MAG: hypothetical protein QM662_13845 [Gordonia sp. (in: high G+C Gram-positive bacteria)]